MGWVTVPLSSDLLAEARARAAALPIYGYSHRQRAANEVGSIGEVVGRDFLKNGQVAFAEEYETTHDFRLGNGKTLDVKTKDRTVAPRNHYECSVPLYNHDHQAVDYYLFLSLIRDKAADQESIERYTDAVVLGAANAAMIRDLGVVKQTGEVDPANGTKFWTACINVRIDQLVAPEKALTAWRNATPAS